MGKRKIISLVIIVGLLISVLLFLGGCFPAAEGEEGETDFIGSIWPMLIFLVGIFAMMYFVMIRPQRKRQQEHQSLMEELKRGDKVITAGGIHGEVETVSDDSVVIKVESGASIRVAKSSVSGKIVRDMPRIS